MILLTGATGNIGTELVKLLVAKGASPGSSLETKRKLLNLTLVSNASLGIFMIPRWFSELSRVSVSCS